MSRFFNRGVTTIYGLMSIAVIWYMFRIAASVSGRSEDISTVDLVAQVAGTLTVIIFAVLSAVQLLVHLKTRRQAPTGSPWNASEEDFRDQEVLRTAARYDHG